MEGSELIDATLIGLRVLKRYLGYDPMWGYIVNAEGTNAGVK
jgi:hypothetical protein